MAAGAKWRRAGRGPDWRMALGIPWKPKGRKGQNPHTEPTRKSGQSATGSRLGLCEERQGSIAPAGKYSQKGCSKSTYCSYNQNTDSKMLTLRSSSLLPAWVGSHLRHLIWCIVSGSALSLKKDQTSSEATSKQINIVYTMFWQFLPGLTQFALREQAARKSQN